MTTPFLAGNLGLGNLASGVLVEPTAAEYQRQPVAFNVFPGGTGSNAAAANFGLVVTSWGTLTAWALFDASGNQVLGDSLASSIDAAAGQYVSVMAGTITISFAAPSPGDNDLTDYNGAALTDYSGNPITAS